MKRGKKYRAVAEKVDRAKIYPIGEAIEIVKENKIAKFDEAVEIHVKTNIDPKKTDQQLRGTAILPHGTGKTKIIAVMTSTKAKEARDAGADIVAGAELIEKIKSGKAFSGKDKFEILVATPEMMAKLAPVAKILGPKGLMPNPKTETVTLKIKETVEALKKGKAAFKSDNTGNVHQVIGKVSFPKENLLENAKAFLSALEKSKPASVKKKLIANISMCSTMGLGLKIQAESIK